MVTAQTTDKRTPTEKIETASKSPGDFGSRNNLKSSLVIQGNPFSTRLASIGALHF